MKHTILAFVFSLNTLALGFPIETAGDFEGSWEQFSKVVDASEVLGWSDNTKSDVVFKNKGGIFVQMGDVTDRGISDMRLLKTFVKLRQLYPNQFFNLLGNRDINKIRLPAELNSSPEAFSAWVKGAYYKTVSTGEVYSRVDRLKWIFSNTMGSPHTFENRRAELRALGKKSDDHSVVDSFLDELLPSGDRFKYLQSGHIALRLNDLVLVHGAFKKENFGIIPNQKKRLSNVNEFISSINYWKDKQLEQWTKSPNALSQNRAASALIQYQEPLPGTRANDLSLVYGRYPDPDGNVRLRDVDFISKLNSDGVFRIVSGHSPQGSLSTLVRSQDGSFQVVVVDTSTYRAGAGLARFHPRFTELLDVDEESKSTRTIVSLNDPNSIIGLVTSDNFLVKRFSAQSREFTLSKIGEGFKEEVKKIPKEELESILGMNQNNLCNNLYKKI